MYTSRHYKYNVTFSFFGSLPIAGGPSPILARWLCGGTPDSSPRLRTTTPACGRLVWPGYRQGPNSRACPGVPSGSGRHRSESAGRHRTEFVFNSFRGGSFFVWPLSGHAHNIGTPIYTLESADRYRKSIAGRPFPRRKVRSRKVTCIHSNRQNILPVCSRIVYFNSHAGFYFSETHNGHQTTTTETEPVWKTNCAVDSRVDCRQRTTRFPGVTPGFGAHYYV